MKIAMIVYSHYSRDARVRRYAEFLSSLAHHVDIICLKETYKPKEKNIRLIQYPLSRRRLNMLWYFIEYTPFFIYSSITLTFLHFKNRYQIIHVHNMPDFLVFTTYIPKLLGAKIIFDMHDPMPELYMCKYHVSQNSLMVRLLKLIEKKSLEYADHIITANEEFRSLFFSRLSRSLLGQGETLVDRKISVILNCPDPAIFNLLPTTHNSQHFILLYMGTVEERFGLDIVVEALPYLVKKIPNLKFVIIPKIEGEGIFFKNLKFRIRNLGLEEYVDILNPMPLEEVVKKIKESNIGIVLAKNGIFTENILPVKLLEFVQMKIPVIATKTKIISQYFNENSICYLQQNTPSEFTKSVLRLYNNPTLRRKFAANAFSFFEKYRWEKEKKKYLKLLKKLI